MTIKQKIEAGLKQLLQEDRQLYDVFYQLHRSMEEICAEAADHLSKVQAQLPDYDRHDKAHSERVIQNIELLLQEKGIRELTLLEAMLIQLCGYLHDTGMAVPDWSLRLLEDVESEDYGFHNTSTPVRDIITELRTKAARLYGSFEQVKDLFFCPERQSGLLTFLAQEVWDYECYRMGLKQPDGDHDRKAYLTMTRQEYLRSTHGQRVRVYCSHMGKKLTCLSEYDACAIAQTVGEICAGHCCSIDALHTLDSQLRICGGISSHRALTYNARFIAMLLRLGDVIHFSTDRASRTLYAEHTPMNPVSDTHWQVKLGQLHYQIRQQDGRTTIAYYAGFRESQLYYFLQDYLDWVDEELQNYAAFVQDMEQLRGEDVARYRIGLPTRTDRSGVTGIGFTPDSKLKFRLEQQKVIQLLMGLRLYSDEFMCLRELYQNALDASRCMQAINEKRGLQGPLPILFGLASDEGGDYLYCQDAGTGMTKEIICNYLLRVGNSYYRSDDFRRNNAIWEQAVAPVSEFGIGLLSCYMIGRRIEVITRHYSDGAQACWICMEGTEDYGYFRQVTADVAELIGKHGTIVKVYLQEKFKSRIHDRLPEASAEDVRLYRMLGHELLEDTRIRSGRYRNLQTSGTVEERVRQFHDSLYQKLQEYIHIPEKGIPVYVQDAAGRRCPMLSALEGYDVFDRELTRAKRELAGALCQCYSWSSRTQPVENILEEAEKWFRHFRGHKLTVTDPQTRLEAHLILHLPVGPLPEKRSIHSCDMDQYVGAYYSHIEEDDIVYIDGIPAFTERRTNGDMAECSGLLLNFTGTVRPLLSVNREFVREIPDEVQAAVSAMVPQVVTAVIEQINAHFEAYPQAKTEGVWNYLDEYLSDKFNTELYYRILHGLAQGLLAEHMLLGSTLSSILTRQEFTVSTSVPVYAWLQQSKLLQLLLWNAERIDVNGDVLQIRHSLQMESPAMAHPHRKDLESCYLCTDTWNGSYAQYDIVNSLWPLVPERVYGLCEGEPIFDDSGLIKKENSAYWKRNTLFEIGRRSFSKHDLGWANRSEILIQLRSTPTDRILFKFPIKGLIEEETKKYVIFAYINPEQLTEADEAELAVYADDPAYIRGLREGWSILFHRYEDGYVVAPGIVSREEMLKKLPDAAKNHTDGVRYYFTDGTEAF